MNPIWVGRFNVTCPKDNEFLEGDAGAWLWIAAQAEDAAKLITRVQFVMSDLGLHMIEHEDLQEVIDQDQLGEAIASLIPEARRNEESVVCGTWHRYKHHDAYRASMIRKILPVVLVLAAGCKSSSYVAQPAVPSQPVTSVPAFPQRPSVKPPSFKVFHTHDSIITLVTKQDATDEEIESLIWELRDAAHSRALDSLKVSQRMVDDRAPIVWFHIYRGTKCAAEKYADGPLPCGNRYNGAGDYTYGGYANKELDRGVIRDGDKETELWDAEKVYVKGS